MTVKIHKYQLFLEEFPSKMMPKGAKILHFGNQQESLVIWAEVDVDIRRSDGEITSAKVVRHFQIVKTGGDAPGPRGASYIGSALFQGGSLVWHLYEIL